MGPNDKFDLVIKGGEVIDPPPRSWRRQPLGSLACAIGARCECA
jgi:hypothetical protein